MPVVDLNQTRNKMPFRWAAMHSGGNRKCDKEAFSYVVFQRPEKKFLGAIVYHRGKKPFEIVQEMIDKEYDCLRCENCGEFIGSEDHVTPAPEIFKVKSLTRYLKIVTDWHNALTAVAKAHVRLLEYGYLMGVEYEMWKEQQQIHDNRLEATQKQLDLLYGFCAGIGPCEARPSELVLRNRFGGTSLSTLQGHGPGGSPGPS